MKVKINNKAENILLSRIEVNGEISFSGNTTPSMQEVQQDVAKELDVDKDLVVIKKIGTLYGESRANVTAYQYFSKDERDNLEPKLVADEKKKAEEAAKKKEEAKEEKPAEAPKEEKKEEKGE